MTNNICFSLSLGVRLSHFILHVNRALTKFFLTSFQLFIWCFEKNLQNNFTVIFRLLFIIVKYVNVPWNLNDAGANFSKWIHQIEYANLRHITDVTKLLQKLNEVWDFNLIDKNQREYFTQWFFFWQFITNNHKK